MLDKKSFTLLAERLSGWAEYIYYHLMGEPTAHPFLPDFIGISTSLGMKSIITTNGTLLAECGDALISAKPHKVSISLHAFEANELDTSFEEYVSSCLDFAKKASQNGIIVVLRLWNLDGRAEGALNTRNESVLQALKAAFPREWGENRSGKRLCDKVFLEWGEKFDWPDMAEQDRGESCFCYALRDQAGILWDGTVVPCCLDHDGDIALGNIFESSMEEILSSPRARAIYEGFSRRRAVEELCRKCGYARRFG